MPAAVSSITRQTVGRTFIVAITILGVIALGQLGAIGWLFCARFRLTPSPASGLRSSVANSSGVAQPKDFTDPFAEVGDSSPTALAMATPVPVGPTPPPAPPRPSPISSQVLTRPAVPTEPTAEDRMNEAIDIARTLRDRGDTYAAVTKLREAETFDPDHPAPKAELAITLEKMGFSEKAAELWKRVYDMGEKAGVYYEAAKAKMEVSKSNALREATTADAPVPITPADNVGMNPASKMGFDPITRTDEHDPHSIQQFTLHVPIRAKARARIDPSFVAVRVLLYDIVEGRQLEVTKASIIKKWQGSLPYDWSDRDTETLDVVYARAYPQQGEPIEDRKFYGYVATVYYKNALQDVHSDPPNLAQRVQIPSKLPEASP